MCLYLRLIFRAVVDAAAIGAARRLLGRAEAVEDLDLVHRLELDARVRPLRHVELDVELDVAERLLADQVLAPCRSARCRWTPVPDSARERLGFLGSSPAEPTTDQPSIGRLPGVQARQLDPAATRRSMPRAADGQGHAGDGEHVAKRNGRRMGIPSKNCSGCRGQWSADRSPSVGEPVVG